MILPVSDHVGRSGEDGVAKDLPRPQDFLRRHLERDRKYGAQGGCEQEVEDRDGHDHMAVL